MSGDIAICPAIKAEIQDLLNPEAFAPKLFFLQTHLARFFAIAS
ncbi:MAG: hypothetical protein ACX93U_00110 [Salipiger thiooxidans]|nr:hypothetical protein [Salipiger thiooxidans]